MAGSDPIEREKSQSGTQWGEDRNQTFALFPFSLVNSGREFCRNEVLAPIDRQAQLFIKPVCYLAFRALSVISIPSNLISATTSYALGILFAAGSGLLCLGHNQTIKAINQYFMDSFLGSCREITISFNDLFFFEVKVLFFTPEKQ